MLEDGLFLPPDTELVLNQRREIDEIDEDDTFQDAEEEDEEAYVSEQHGYMNN